MFNCQLPNFTNFHIANAVQLICRFLRVLLLYQGRLALGKGEIGTCTFRYRAKSAKYDFQSLCAEMKWIRWSHSRISSTTAKAPVTSRVTGHRSPLTAHVLKECSVTFCSYTLLNFVYPCYIDVHRSPLTGHVLRGGSLTWVRRIKFSLISFTWTRYKLF